MRTNTVRNEKKPERIDFPTPSTPPNVDISNVPLNNNVLDVAVFSLSLMGSNSKEYLEEGHRTLKPYGIIMICEPKSKWEENPNKLVDTLKEIGFTANIERTTDKFIYVVGTKI